MTTVTTTAAGMARDVGTVGGLHHHGATTPATPAMPPARPRDVDGLRLHHHHGLRLLNVDRLRLLHNDHLGRLLHHDRARLRRPYADARANLHLRSGEGRERHRGDERADSEKRSKVH